MFYLTNDAAGLYRYAPTPDESAMLDSLIDVDGHDEVIEAEAPLTNSSGRVIGTETFLRDGAWEVVIEAMEAAEANEAGL